MDNDWAALAAQSAHVGQAGDPHRVLLDVLGLHSGSVEFHQRYAESLQDLYNRLNLGGAGGRFMAALSAAGSTRAGVDLLQRLGYDGQRPCRWRTRRRPARQPRRATSRLRRSPLPSRPGAMSRPRSRRR
jgi:hypothetical protein